MYGGIPTSESLKNVQSTFKIDNYDNDDNNNSNYNNDNDDDDNDNKDDNVDYIVRFCQYHHPTINFFQTQNSTVTFEVKWLS